MDVAIIGSGISGTNLARNLLSKRPNLKVVVLEARDLCSGATGRNGGHIKPMAFAVWEDRVRRYGVAEAIKVAEFEHSHLAAMTSAAAVEQIDCDVIFTEGIDAYFDEPTFARALTALEKMRLHAPHVADTYSVYTDRGDLQKTLKLSDRCVGAIGVPSASFWPYKFVVGLMERLIRDEKLNVQTGTTVKSIDEEQGAEYAVVHTNRGKIRAQRVVHATNGWLGHLLPELRPFLSPVRGNVVHLAARTTPGASPLGFEPRYSYWFRYAEKDYDYLIQRRVGDIVVGRANIGRRATANDGETDLLPMAHLRGFGHEVARRPLDNVVDSVDHAWSGILAFTEDGAPFVGRLPFPQYTHQWVCGGYHGIGMTKAFRTAEMMAFLLLDEQSPAEYPRSMMMNSKRLHTLRQSVAAAAGNAQSKL